MEAGEVTTIIGKEAIKEIQKMLAHARADKVLHNIGNAYEWLK